MGTSSVLRIVACDAILKLQAGFDHGGVDELPLGCFEGLADTARYKDISLPIDFSRIAGHLAGAVGAEPAYRAAAVCNYGRRGVAQRAG